MKFFSTYEVCDLKISYGRSYTGQEALIAAGEKEMGYFVRDLQRARDIARKERIEAANKELGRQNEGPKKKQPISEDEWRLVREVRRQRGSRKRARLRKVFNKRHWYILFIASPPLTLAIINTC